MPKLNFEKLDAGTTLPARLNRAKIPGGWLLVSVTTAGVGMTFVSDPEHKWDVTSLAHKPKNTDAAAP